MWWACNVNALLQTRAYRGVSDDDCRHDIVAHGPATQSTRFKILSAAWKGGLPTTRQQESCLCRSPMSWRDWNSQAIAIMVVSRVCQWTGELLSGRAFLDDILHHS